MRLHERIAAYAVGVIAGARDHGEREVKFVAREVADALGLVDRTPAICSKLGSIGFQNAAGAKLVHRDGPHQSPLTSFTFAL